MDRGLGKLGTRSSIAVGAMAVVIVAAGVAGCGGSSQDRPSYDATDVGASWVDQARGASNALVTHGDTVCSTQARDVWQLPAADLGAVYADGQRAYTTTSDRQPIVALDPDSGAELWRAEIGDAPTAGGVVGVTPVLGGAAIAVTVDGQPGRVVLLDTASGAHPWDEDLDAEDPTDVSIASSDQVVYINDTLLRADDETGEVQWLAPAAGDRLGPSRPLRLVAEHGRLFTLAEGVWDIDVDGGGGRQMRQDVNPSDITVVGGRVVIAGAEQMEAVPLVRR